MSIKKALAIAGVFGFVGLGTLSGCDFNSDPKVVKGVITEKYHSDKICNTVPVFNCYPEVWSVTICKSSKCYDIPVMHEEYDAVKVGQYYEHKR